MDMQEAIFKSAWERLTGAQDFRTAIDQATAALAGGRIHPYQAPADAAIPYLVNRVGGRGGGPSTDLVVGTTRLDVHIFDSAATPRRVWAIRDAVVMNLENWIDVSQPAAEHIRYSFMDSDELPEEEQLFHLVVAFSVRYARSKLIERLASGEEGTNATG